MKQSEIIIQEILYQCLEKKMFSGTQAELSRTLKFSLSTVNRTITVLARIGAIVVHARNFEIIDAKKILYYWASTRNLKKDIIYQTRVDLPVREIQKLMPSTIKFTAYTAYVLRFKDVPADYSEVYVYGDTTLEGRFPKKEGPPNLFVLRFDPHLQRYTSVPIATIFVDLWNCKEWYAKEFIKALEVRLNGILE